MATNEEAMTMMMEDETLREMNGDELMDPERKLERQILEEEKIVDMKYILKMLDGFCGGDGGLNEIDHTVCKIVYYRVLMDNFKVE